MATARSGLGFGVDIGGSGIKGCTVDLEKGTFAADRVRIPTPEESTPDNVVPVVAEVVRSFDWDGPFGCTFPGVVQHGVVRSAANVDRSWIGTNLEELLAEATGLQVAALNDADAAGVAEERFGAAAHESGVVLVTTLGTGIGSALLVNGVLVPNTELGHLELDGHDAETRAADSARERKELSWSDWTKRLQRYYSHLEALFSPDLFVVGGGVSKKADKFLDKLDLRTPIVPAGLLNDGGIIGAALVAAERYAEPTAERSTQAGAPAATRSSGTPASATSSAATPSASPSAAKKKNRTAAKKSAAKTAPAKKKPAKSRR